MKKKKPKQAEIIPLESAHWADKRTHNAMLGHLRKTNKRGKNGKK